MKPVPFLRSLSAALVGAVPLLSAQDAPPRADAQPAAGPPAWPHEESDIRPDPRITWGRLENGVRYAILPNFEPPERVSLRLYVDAGSLMEEDDQQGLAHFLEHMAFNGTTHYPANEMVEFFQRLGMAFGADTNAHTSFSETVYKLELPEASASMLDKGLLFFSDVAAGMLLAEQEINRERGIILSEKRARDNVDYRIMVEGFRFGLPESLIPRRLPIGTDEVISVAPRQRFVDFYRKWYTPDRLTVVATGDADVDALRRAILTRFADLPAPARTAGNPDFGRVTTGTGVQARLHTEMEAGGITINIDCPRPSRKRPDSAASRRENLAKALADRIVTRRLEILARKPDSPFLGAEVSSDDWMQFVESASLQMMARPENWEKALAVAEQELRRALLHGFTTAEFEEAKANVLNVYANAARTADTRKSRDLADALVRALVARRVFDHPEDAHKLAEAQLGQLTVADCAEAFRDGWKSGDLRIFIGGNLKLENGDARIIEAWKASSQVPVDPPAEEAGASFAYTDFGTPGKVTATETHQDLDVTQITFANNIRVTFKPTTYRKDTIQVQANVGDGKLTMPEDRPGIDILAGATMDSAGLARHSTDDLKRLLAGRTAGISFSIAEDTFVLSGRTNRADLLLQLQLLAAWLSEPGFREDGLTAFRQGIPAFYQQVGHTPEGILQTAVNAFTHGDDYRFRLPPQEVLESRTMAEVKEWLEPALTRGYVEIGVVGDFEPDALIDALSRTVGALPGRPAARDPLTSRRSVKFPEGIRERDFPFTSSIPKAVVAVYWPTTDRREDIRHSRHLALLGEILSDRVRVRVREELGESYSPHVASMMSDTFPGYGQMFSLMIAEPKDAAKLGEIVRGLGADLAAQGASEDELERARRPLLTSLEEQLRNNDYWLRTVLTPAPSIPSRLEWARTILQDFRSAGLDSINECAKRYLKPDRATVVRIVPAG